MPELPEVETICQDLQQIKGTIIKQVKVYDGRVCRNVSAADLKRRLQKQTIERIYRRSKAVVFECSGKWILSVQLGMTGNLLIEASDARKKSGLKDTKIVIVLSNGKYLNYNDQRMFGRWNLGRRVEDIDYLARLGPEPLTENFNLKYFQEKLKARSVQIKVALLDQKCVAGLGNIYAAEALFYAKIDPRVLAKNLSEKQIQRLVKAIKQVLALAIEKRGTTLRNYKDAFGDAGTFAQQLYVYGREGENCRVCHKKIVKIVQAQRSTFFCAKCQKSAKC